MKPIAKKTVRNGSEFQRVLSDRKTSVTPVETKLPSREKCYSENPWQHHFPVEVTQERRYTADNYPFFITNIDRNSYIVITPSELGICLGWKGQYICCVTRGREGRGGEGRGGEGRGGEGVREGGGERGGRGGREGRDDCYTLLF